VPAARFLDTAVVAALGVATALVIVCLAILPFLTPAFVEFEQGRADSAAWTRMAPADQAAVTEAILADLVIRRGDFEVTLGGSPVLDAAERGHMRDVRDVFTGLYALGLLSAVGLAGAWLRARAGGPAAGRLRRGVSVGARWLAVLIVVAGAFALVAFDAAFEVFHRLFFAAGTYTFDPATSRLVQLFPDAFWSETAMLVGGTILALCLVVAWTTRRSRGPRLRPEAGA
jgi:integral membrane protein (TIGR01906 family)